MIAEQLLRLIDDAPELRAAFGEQPHFKSTVTLVLGAANHGLDDDDQLLVLLHGFVAACEALQRSMDAHAETMKRRPEAPWLVRLDGTLVEHNPEGAP